MNQILFTNNNNNNNYDKVDTKKIIKFFCIAIIIVAIIIMGIKLYGLYEKKKLASNNKKPEIIIEKEESQTKEVTIKATCEDGIQYLVYIWNDEQENRVNLNGSKSFERIIEIPENTINNLKVEVFSIKGETNRKTEVFDKGIGDKKPAIDSITITNQKLNIQASDDTGIKYLAYKWENEEEVKIYPEEENAKTMNTELDIKRGTYKLYVTVIDIYDNEETLSRLITGVNEPEIIVIKYGGVVNISVTHDMGFKKIEFIINKKKYVYDENYSKYDKNKTTVQYEFPLEEGENKVQVTAYSLEKINDEDNQSENELDNYAFKRYTGKCTYQP